MHHLTIISLVAILLWCGVNAGMQISPNPVSGQFPSRIQRQMHDSLDTIHRNSSPKRLFDFIRKHNAVSCLQTVICQLTRNENILGKNGARFMTRLKSLGPGDAESDIKAYRLARKIGWKIASPAQCASFFPGCEHEPEEIIIMGLIMTTSLP